MNKNLNDYKLTDDDLKIINQSLNGSKTFKSLDEVKSLSKVAIMTLIEDNLSALIGYDEKKGDIDELGEKADDIISKLLVFLRKRGEM